MTAPPMTITPQNLASIASIKPTTTNAPATTKILKVLLMAARLAPRYAAAITQTMSAYIISLVMAVACAKAMSKSKMSYANRISRYSVTLVAVAASSALLLLNGAAAVLGPILGGVLMDQSGENAYFITLGGLAVVLAVFCLWRRSRRAPVPREQRGPYIKAQPETTAVTEESQWRDAAHPRSGTTPSTGLSS